MSREKIGRFTKCQWSHDLSLRSNARASSKMRCTSNFLDLDGSTCIWKTMTMLRCFPRVASQCRTGISHGRFRTCSLTAKNGQRRSVWSSGTPPPTRITHSLQSLTANEIQRASKATKTRLNGDNVRFVAISLSEPGTLSAAAAAAGSKRRSGGVESRYRNRHGTYHPTQ